MTDRDDIIRIMRNLLGPQSESWDVDHAKLDEFMPLFEAIAAAERTRMIADGWRQCAQGQRTTQFCGMAEQVRQDAERYKANASMWRNKAYELGGTPLPWDADEMLEKAVRAERDACARLCEDSIDLEPYPTLTEMAVAIRARGQTPTHEDDEYGNPSF